MDEMANQSDTGTESDADQPSHCLRSCDNKQSKNIARLKTPAEKKADKFGQYSELLQKINDASENQSSTATASSNDASVLRVEELNPKSTSLDSLETPPTASTFNFDDAATKIKPDDDHEPVAVEEATSTMLIAYSNETYLTDEKGILLPDLTIKSGKVVSIAQADITIADVLRNQNCLAFKMKGIAMQMDRMESMLKQIVDGGGVSSSATPRTHNSTQGEASDTEAVQLKTVIRNIEEMNQLEDNLKSTAFLKKFVSIY